MEPTIYNKPSIYKGTVVYKTPGIYNGLGVYKDGAGGNFDGILYETDFSNFDTDTLIDYPLIGEPMQYTLSRGTYTKTTKNVDGEILPCLHLNQGGVLNFHFLKIDDISLVSVEFVINKDSFQGVGCGGTLRVGNGNTWYACPFFNCYSPDRGLGCDGFANPQDGFSSYSWGIANSNSSIRTNVTKLHTAGQTFDKQNKLMKAFIDGKKAAWRNLSDTSLEKCNFRIYSDDSSSTQMNVFRIRIYKDVDIYERME